MRLLPLILLCACKVYLPPCEPGDERANPAGGVTVRVNELGDNDGGDSE